MDDIDPIAPHRLAAGRRPQHGAAHQARRAACRDERPSFMARAVRLPVTVTVALVPAAASASRTALALDAPQRRKSRCPSR